MHIPKAGNRLRRLSAFLCLSLAGRLATADTARIEYPSVHVALRALLSRRDIKIEVRDRWTIIQDAAGQIWTFVPIDHPAYPTVMRQRIFRSADGAIHSDMAALCEAEKMPCDKVMEILRQRNRETAAELKFRETQTEALAP
ncbi:hypothetical protein [Viridibacterium curvum]|uniref:Uncharacterized protein n=1 Tax=Viridibacterium curvum TaxID=1101404 RepID=A0ABP9QWR6_9RHOO